VLFYKAWHSSLLFFSQTMANRILRVPTNFHIPSRSAFFLFLLRLQWSDQLPCKISDEQMKHASQGVLNSIWKTANPTTTSSRAKNSVTKWEVLWRVFLKGSTWKFTWNGLKIPCIGIYSELFEITWFLVLWCTRSIPSQYRWRLAKDWERPTKRAITVIIMYRDKTLLTKA
jgi:hypothetical protein